MAQEISVTAQLQATKGSFVLPKFGGAIKVDMAVARGGNPGVMQATNAAQGVNVPNTGLTTLGFCLIQNIDAAAVVDYGVVTGGVLQVLATLKPGEVNIFRLKPGITWAVKSSVASSDVQIIQIND